MRETQCAIHVKLEDVIVKVETTVKARSTQHNVRATVIFVSV